MIEGLYDIGTRLLLDDQIIGQLDAVDGKFADIEAKVAGINSGLGATNTRVNTLTASVHDLAAAFGSAAEAAGRINVPGGAGGGGYLPSGGGDGQAPGEPSEPGARHPGTALATIPGQGPHGPAGPELGHRPFDRSGGTPNGPDSAGGGAPPNFTIPDGPDEPFNPPGRPSLGSDSDGGGRSMGLHDLFFGAAALDMGGRVVAAGFGTVSSPQDQVTRMRLLDKKFTEADGAKVLSAAKDMLDPSSKNYVPGMSLTGALTIIANGYQQTRDVDEAIAMAHPLAAAAVRLEATGNYDAVDQIMDLGRAAEAAGALNHKNSNGSVDIAPFTTWVDNATQIAQSTPGVDPHQILLQTQQNDVGAMSVNEQGQSYDDILISALGGYKSGSGLAALNREFVGGKMSTGTFDVLARLHLVNPKGASKNGQYYTLAPGALVGQELFDSNPVKWLETVFTNAVNKASPDDRNAMLHDIYSGTGTATGARDAGFAVLQDAFIARQLYYAENDEPSPAQSMTDISNNPSTVMKSAGYEISNVANSLLNPASGYVTQVIKDLNADLAHAAEHPSYLLNPINPVAQIGDILGGFFGRPGTQIPTPAPIGGIESVVAGFFQKIVALLENPLGKTAGQPVYVKPVPGTPTTALQTGPTGGSTVSAPPIQGQRNVAP